ncbi:MAG: Lrp/AsnC family transcriptional regulator [Vicinamibacteria bacterium]
MSTLDRIDRVILTELQNNARLSNKEVAARVGLAPSTCLTRVRRLEATGAIAGYRAELDPASLGLGLQALISVYLNRHAVDAFGAIGPHLRSLPEALAVYCLGGAIDFLVHVACRDTEHLRQLTLRVFGNRPEVSRIETSLVFSFTRSGLPVEAAEPKPAGLEKGAERTEARPGTRGGRKRRPRRAGNER